MAKSASSKKAPADGSKKPAAKSVSQNSTGPADPSEGMGTTTSRDVGATAAQPGLIQGDTRPTSETELRAIKGRQAADLGTAGAKRTDGIAQLPASGAMRRVKIVSSAESVIALTINGIKAELRVGKEYDLAENQIQALLDANVITEDVNVD